MNVLKYSLLRRWSLAIVRVLNKVIKFSSVCRTMEIPSVTAAVSPTYKFQQNVPRRPRVELRGKKYVRRPHGGSSYENGGKGRETIYSAELILMN